MKKLTSHDLLLINERARTFIEEFPNGGKLRGAPQPLNESQIRTLAFVDAVLAIQAGSSGIEFEVEIPDSETTD